MSSPMTTYLSAEALDVDACAHPEVTDVAYNLASLRITVKDLQSGAERLVEFVEVEGFRVLDGSDLLEFWPICSELWLYQISEGGWLEQECLRPGFTARDSKNVLEFFVRGENACVSVLAWSVPVVTLSESRLSWPSPAQQRHGGHT